MPTLTWDGTEYDLVDVADMTLGEGAACEKWLGVGQESWGTNQATLAAIWVTLKRRFPQMARTRVEALTWKQVNEILHDEDEDDPEPAGEPEQGQVPRDPTGLSAAEVSPSSVPPT